MMNEEKKPELGNEPGGLLTPKRKQGRPRKNHVFTPGEKSLMLHKVDVKIRRPRQKKNNIPWPAVADGDFIGQQVHGVLDGSFDAGYLLTVRVGDSQTVLRGVVFEPSLSMPISKANDIAPNVKFTKRDELVAPPIIQQLTLTAGPPVVTSTTATLSAPAHASTTVTHATQCTSKDHQSSQVAKIDSCGLVPSVDLQPQSTVQILHELGNSVPASVPEKSGSFPTLQEPSITAPTPQLEESGPQQQVDV